MQCDYCDSTNGQVIVELDSAGRRTGRETAACDSCQMSGAVTFLFKEPKVEGFGVIRISQHLMLNWMALPESFEIIEAYMKQGGQSNYLELKVKDKDMPIIPEGAEIPVLTPVHEMEVRGGYHWYRLKGMRVNG